ncbi:MAG: hypothetical protein KA248_12155 [Kiritimatiellae bacterium]|nr:hypothetical protein [Kiritimatiellia bacterium]
MTCAISPLHFRLRDLMLQFPSSGAATMEDWLLDVANVRGADFVLRVPPRDPGFEAPGVDELSNEDLVAAICHLQNEDRPQMLRAAAQLISRKAVDADRLCLSARRERVEPVLSEMARQAIRVDAGHPVWKALHERLSPARPLREPILHWTRMAVPVPDERGCNARAWRLIA